MLQFFALLLYFTKKPYKIIHLESSHVFHYQILAYNYYYDDDTKVPFTKVQVTQFQKQGLLTVKY